MNRRKFRFSRTLYRAGVSEAKQHIIYGTLIRQDKTAAQDASIRCLCRETGGRDDADGLYRFLTDNTIDHNYIEMNYGIRPTDLFNMKREFYRKYAERFI